MGKLLEKYNPMAIPGQNAHNQLLLLYTMALPK